MKRSANAGRTPNVVPAAEGYARATPVTTLTLAPVSPSRMLVSFADVSRRCHHLGPYAPQGSRELRK